MLKKAMAPEYRDITWLKMNPDLQALHVEDGFRDCFQSILIFDHFFNNFTITTHTQLSLSLLLKKRLIFYILLGITSDK